MRQEKEIREQVEQTKVIAEMAKKRNAILNQKASKEKVIKFKDELSSERFTGSHLAKDSLETTSNAQQQTPLFRPKNRSTESSNAEQLDFAGLQALERQKTKHFPSCERVMSFE